MSKVLTYKCADFVFDFYSSERVPNIKSDVKYFMTPGRLNDVCEWMSMRGFSEVSTNDQMEELIAIGLVGEYVNDRG